jgi:hypothetical protein
MARGDGELVSINSKPMHASNGYGVVNWPGRKPLIFWWVKNMMLIRGTLTLSSIFFNNDTKQSFSTLVTSDAYQMNMSMTYQPRKCDQDMIIFLFIRVRTLTLDSNTRMEHKSLFKNTWTPPCTDQLPNLFRESCRTRLSNSHFCYDHLHAILCMGSDAWMWHVQQRQLLVHHSRRSLAHVPASH